MDFELSEEQMMIKKMVRDFMAKEYPDEVQLKDDVNGTYPLGLLPKMAELDLLRKIFPSAYGGLDGTIIDECLILEELSRASEPVGLDYFFQVCFGGKTIEFTGSEEQKREYLPKICDGKLRAALALTEAEGGTDILGSLRATARQDGDGFVINGAKYFITAAHVADILITVARTSTDPKRKARGLSMFIVPAKSKGVTINRIDKMVIRAMGSCEVIFEDVKVPKENLIGEIDKGWYSLVNTLNNERVTLAACSVGGAQGVLDYALDYAKQRYAFGKPIGQFQAIQHYLAEMKADVECARLLMHEAAWAQSMKKLETPVLTTMAKWIAAEVHNRTALKGIRILGGAGIETENPMQRHYRDSTVLLFAPISNEMARNLVGESMGLPKSY